MSFSMFLFTLLNVWCVMLFITLAFGIRKNDEDSPVAYAAAPQNVNWKKRLLINTVLSIVITLLIALIINSGIIEVRE